MGAMVVQLCNVITLVAFSVRPQTALVFGPWNASAIVDFFFSFRSISGVPKARF